MPLPSPGGTARRSASPSCQPMRSGNTWFPAMWLVATAKNGISSVEPGRRLGIEQTNAWALEQKIVAVTTAREDAERLDGRVEMDDAYLGGHRPGRRGRGTAGERPFVAAVSTGDDRRPREIELLPVKGFREEEVRKLVAEHLTSTSRPVADGLGRGRPGAHRRGDRQRSAGGAMVAVRAGEHDPGATSRRRSSAPAAGSTPSMRAATSPASPGATTGASGSTASSRASSAAPSGRPRCPTPSPSPAAVPGYSGSGESG